MGSNRPSIPYRRSDPKKLAADMNAIIKDQEERRAAEAAKRETDTYAPVSPPAMPPTTRRSRRRRVSSQGIVTSHRTRNDPV